MNDKQTLLNILATTGATVTFTKVDDTVRVLRGTRNFTDIPASLYPKQDSLPVVVNENNIRLFDLDQCQWRSFNFDTLIEYSYSTADQKTITVKAAEIVNE